MKTPDGLNDPKTILNLRGPGTLSSGATGPKHSVFVALGITLGWLGAHNWYAGRYMPALGQLLLTLLGFSVIVGPIGAAVWAWIEVLTVSTDGDGNPLG